MESVDISEFVQATLRKFMTALEQAGLDLQHVTMKASPRDPFGSWKHPVVVYSWDRPVAKYWLSYPVRDGQKTVKFNVETFETIREWLKPNPQPPQQPKPPAPSIDSIMVGEV